MKDVSSTIGAPGARGRRRGHPDTRERIRVAARKLFLADGYRAVTMRSIAAAAGVDVALVSYYFGSKNGVFSAAMSLPISPIELIDAAIEGDPDTIAERLLRALLAAWDDPRIGVPLRTSASTAIGETALSQLVAEMIEREIVARIAERLPGPEPYERAAIFVTQMSGVIFHRYLLRVEPIASMPVEEIVRRLVPSLQSALEL